MTPVHLSFAACGFLGVYHLGAASTFRVHGARLLGRAGAFAGASAGALVAAVLVTAPEKIEACKRFACELVEETQRRLLGTATPGYDFMARLRCVMSHSSPRAGVERILPPDAHERAHGRLHVLVTNARSRENRLVSRFNSRDDLVQVLLASSFIPFYAGLNPVEYGGQTWADGGLTDSLPVLPGGRTVTISPFCGCPDVSPQDAGWRELYVRVSNQDVAVSLANLLRLKLALFPSPTWRMESLFHDGFSDAMHFLHREGWCQ